MTECDHKHTNGTIAVENVLFYETDKFGKKSLQVDYILCILCGKRFIVSG